MKRVWVAAAMIVTFGSTYAADHVWLIGGGPGPDESQAQIELNVGWVSEVLHTRAPSARQHIFYTDGAAPGRDVKRWERAAETKQALQPLARVFGQYERNGDRYRDHQIKGVVGGTEAESLSARLQTQLAALTPGDRALLIYNGHGWGDEYDVANNTLRLWKHTTLSVREMERLLGVAPPAVPVRFILTQCYAGGFARLVHRDAEDVLALAPGRRCGFMAESAYREAEGCAAGIKIGDYRDYTTYFFAALNRRTRTGAALAGDPDLDRDGHVTLYEAHLYAVAYAHNADLPRATSETFLERWQPWYLRWLNTGAEPDNVYGRIARDVAGRLGLPTSGRALIDALTTRRNDLHRQMSALAQEKTGAHARARRLQKEIQADVALRWPEAMHPHTLGYARFLRQDVGRAQDVIMAHPQYGELVSVQDRLLALDQERLALERDITQLDKVRRMRQLARLLDQFERYASTQEREWYAQLLGCEQQPL